LADQKAGDTCAQSLAAEPRLIFNETSPNLSKYASVKEALEALVRPMVMGGKVSRSTARDSAEAAGHCLVLIGK
jgi:hypothetical protein